MMSPKPRDVRVALNQDIVEFDLDEDIALTTAISLEEATHLVNDKIAQEWADVDLDDDSRNELAVRLIHSELVTRYLAEKARRAGATH